MFSYRVFSPVAVLLLFIFHSVTAGAQQVAGLLPEAATNGVGANEFFSLEFDQFSLDFFVRLLINVAIMLVLIRGIYFRNYGRYDFFFTFFMFNLIIFIISYLLNADTGFSIGAAFGLFAIFAMLRYRTEDISARDMTYLFMSITIGLICSIHSGSILELLIISAIIILGAFLIEGHVFVKPEFSKVVEYENIELIKPDRYQDLLKDLETRTGLKIHKVEVKRLDFLRDTAIIKVYYRNGKTS